MASPFFLTSNGWLSSTSGLSISVSLNSLFQEYVSFFFHYYDKAPKRASVKGDVLFLLTFWRNCVHGVREGIVLWVCLRFLPGNRPICFSLCISSAIPFHAIMFYNLIKFLEESLFLDFSCSYIFCAVNFRLLV